MWKEEVLIYGTSKVSNNFSKGRKEGKNEEINGEAIQPFAQRKKRSPSKWDWG